MLMAEQKTDYLTDMVMKNLNHYGISSFIREIEATPSRDRDIFNFCMDTCLRVFQISKSAFLDNKKLRMNKVRNESRCCFYYVVLFHTGFKQIQIASLFRLHSSNIKRGRDFVHEAKKNRQRPYYHEFLALYDEVEARIESFKNKIDG